MTARPLLARARKAAFDGQYQLAGELYAEALTLPEHRDNLDLQLRYAWCAQKCGRLDEAERVYRLVQERYRKAGEEAAAAMLDETLAGLAGLRAEDASFPRQEETVEPLPEQELADALCGMGRIRQLHAGERLCEAGAPPDALWLLQYGTLRVVLPDYDEHDYLQARPASMMLAGEIGVFTRQRRLATLIAEDEVGVVEVASADIYRRSARDRAFAEGMEELMRSRWVMPVLSQHAIFNRINDIDRRRLVDAFELRSYEPGQVIVEAGAECDGAFMLQSGCLFYMHSEDACLDGQFETDTGELVVSVLPGDIVHLGGLLQDFVSPYRIMCATPVQLLHLSRAAFEPFAVRRPWIIRAILEFSRRPAHLQVMRPADDYLWSADRRLVFGRKEGE